MEDAYASSQAYFEETLTDARQAFKDLTDAATGAIENFQAARLAEWNQKKEAELVRARRTKDSYYRYHLLKLVTAKDQAVLGA